MPLQHAGQVPRGRRWLGVVLSLFVPGFGLVPAGYVLRGVVWLVGLYCGIVVVSSAFIWAALPSWICYAASALLVALWLAMLVDSFRPGRLTGSLIAIWVVALLLRIILPSPAS